MASSVARSISRSTGLNRTKVTKTSRMAFRRAVQNRYRRKTAGGNGG